MINGISVIIPAYQEAENLRNILPLLNNELIQLGITYEIIVVDTIDKLDDTYEVCENNNCYYIKRQGGDNYGDAIRTGFSLAKYSFTVVMDGDGSHDPRKIKDFYAEINKGYDLVIGSRYTKGGGSQNSFVLKVMSYMLNLTYRILFGINAKDISDSYRMYRTEQIQGINFECDNFDIVEEILIKLSLIKNNYRIKEVPIFFSERKAGVSKRNLWKFILSYLTTIRQLKQIKKNYK